MAPKLSKMKKPAAAKKAASKPRRAAIPHPEIQIEKTPFSLRAYIDDVMAKLSLHLSAAAPLKLVTQCSGQKTQFCVVLLQSLYPDAGAQVRHAVPDPAGDAGPLHRARWM